MSTVETDKDELLQYYWRELTYLRKMGEGFARRHPKVAARLELEADQSTDPHVERLIESFAFLTGRIQHQIDNEFPEVATELLNALYPHYLNPVPSMSIAQFQVDPDRGKMTTGHRVKKNTSLFAQADAGQICRFRTCYPVTLWPVEVSEVRIESPERFELMEASRVAAVVRLRLRSLAGPLAELDLKRLRFYLNGDRITVQRLYQLLFTRVFRVATRSGPEDRIRYLPEGSLLPVGFGAEEDVLPQPSYAHPAFRLVQEYFVFSDKYNFFDIDHLSTEGAGETLDLMLLLDAAPEGRLDLTSDTFALGCTPIINLFTKTTEPIRVDHRDSEYRLIPDVHREKTTEIHSILSVSASADADDHTRDVQPFYSFSHEMSERQHKAFWHARRVASTLPGVVGTEILLSFLDLEFEPSRPPSDVLFAHTLCTNRDLAQYFPAGGIFQTDDSVPARAIRCLRKPSRQITPPLQGQTLWRLISHLSLNYLSLSGGEESLIALREILRLYSFYDSSSLEDQARGIRKMEQRKVVRQQGSDAWRGFCRGNAITLTFDESLYVGSGAFLLGSVLNHFFALYASTNSFTELTIKSQQRKGVWKQWPPMVGEHVLL